MIRTGKWRTDWSGRLGCINQKKTSTGRKRVLIHAVSVGEVNAVRELVSMLSEPDSGVEVIVSTTTDTGYARACSLFEQVVRYPLDFSRAVNRFLDRVKPDLVALVELEVWPNFVCECHRRNIPVCVINGRLSEKSHRRYRTVRPFIRPAFTRLAATAVQTAAYARRFESLGVPAEHIHILDTMKWDTACIADHVDGADELAMEMGIDHNRPILVAGSTGPGEEQMLIDQRPKGVQLILVPRKPERFDEVAKLSPGIIRRSQHPAGQQRPVDHTMLFLLDTMGELRKAYALADVVIVGRSFNGQGGSDPIEPAALGKPVVIGPDHFNFADVVDAFHAENGMIVTRQPGEAAARLLADPDEADTLARRGRSIIMKRQGATRRHDELIRQLINKHTKQGSIPAQMSAHP